ncbi:MAG: Rieske (2Fe-2S) protein [Candidatus Rokubacteria bacterium]|nr:Rieske (2Fe-2S) protein [Candidatus Rokubacteria bacterium]
MDFIPIARVDEVPTGATRLFGTDGVRVLLARVGDTVHALQPTCPHRGCDWDGAAVQDEIITCPRCRFRYSARTGLNPLTTACHVNQSTAEYHYRNFPEGRADLHAVRLRDGRVEVSATPLPFRKVIV